jgi:mRNA interferase MazF
VVLAVDPFTDLSGVKRRPALVVSSSDREGKDCILAFITSQPDTTDPTDLPIPSDHSDLRSTGLRAPSVVGCGKLMTIHPTLLTGRLGELSTSLMVQVDT